MERLIFSLGRIFLGLLLGFLLQWLIHRGIIKTRYTVESIRKTLQKIAILFLSPICVLGSLWVVNFGSLKIVALLFVGIFALVLGGFLAFLYSRQRNMPRYQAGAFIIENKKQRSSVQLTPALSSDASVCRTRRTSPDKTRAL